MMELENLTIIYKGKLGKRRCYRVFHRELKSIIKLPNNQKKLFDIKDLNTYGIAFYVDNPKNLFNINDEVQVSIFFKKKLILKNIKARVIRIENNIVGCEFLNLTKKQEYTLDELCVTVQKELINMIKKGEINRWQQEVITR